MLVKFNRDARMNYFMQVADNFVLGWFVSKMIGVESVENIGVDEEFSHKLFQNGMSVG